MNKTFKLGLAGLVSAGTLWYAHTHLDTTAKKLATDSAISLATLYIGYRMMRKNEYGFEGLSVKHHQLWSQPGSGAGRRNYQQGITYRKRRDAR